MIWLGAILLGFAGSIHCLSMCGPIALALPLGNRSFGGRLAGYTTFHVFRIAAYGSIGLIFGMIGLGLHAAGWQQVLSVLAGIIMLLATWLPSIVHFRKGNNPWSAAMYSLRNRMIVLMKDERSGALAGLGFLNGFLPCGLVQIALIQSVVTAHPLSGSLFMMLFGLGTLPAMFALVLGWARMSKMRIQA